MKGLQPLVSSVVLIAAVLIGTFITLNVLIPSMEKIKENSAFIQAKQRLSSLDGTIKEVLIESPGAKRMVKLTTSKGYFRLTEEGVFFVLPITTKICEPGSSVKEGNLLISCGSGVKAYEKDVDNDGNTDLVIENQAVLFAVRKFTGPYDFINTTSLVTQYKIKGANFQDRPKLKIEINRDAATSYGYGYTKLIEKGDNLPYATIMLHLSANESTSNVTYDAFFTLYGGLDYVTVNINVK